MRPDSFIKIIVNGKILEILPNTQIDRNDSVESAVLLNSDFVFLPDINISVHYKKLDL